MANLCGLQCDACGRFPQSIERIQRRKLNGASLIGLGFLLHPRRAPGAEQQRLHLVPYSDERNGFTLLRPEQWSKVEKDGAAALFEDPGNKSNTLGVVVSPVRISSLSQFGAPRDVADRLITAERNKASTKSVELLEAGIRAEDPAFYEIEYKLDSTRGGLKRIFSAVTIWSRNLYIVNLAVSDDAAEESAARAVVDSFHVVKK